MMHRRLAFLPLLALAGISLSGCVAVAIPVIAGSAMAGSRLNDKGAGAAAALEAVAVATPAPVAPAPAIAAAPATLPPPPVVQGVTPPPAAPERPGFAQFVRYGAAAAKAGTSDTAPLSAMLKDPIATDGQRRRCEVGEQQVALIDLDPIDGVFAPPASPAEQPNLALGLAVLREAGVVIAWLSDLSVNESGGLRTALEQSGLDPRGEDIISLRRDAGDRKQQRKDNLAGITCIIAIAGDERPDFDERFKYLRSPEAGAELEPVIGDGWFLIEPVFATEGKMGQ